MIRFDSSNDSGGVNVRVLVYWIAVGNRVVTFDAEARGASSMGRADEFRSCRARSSALRIRSMGQTPNRRNRLSQITSSGRTRKCTEAASTMTPAMAPCQE